MAGAKHTSKKKKQAARSAVQAALRAGELKVAERCAFCPQTAGLLAHHPDYDKPLEVTWVCGGCHVKLHQEDGVRPSRDRSRDAGIRRPQPFSIRITDEALDHYRRAAEAAGMSMAEWARLVLDVAAGVSDIRFVFHIDVGSKTPEEAQEMIHEMKKRLKEKDKVRDGKW